MTEEISIRKITEIIKDIENGALDLSRFKKKPNYIKIPVNASLFLLINSVMAYISYESSKTYGVYGEEGAKTGILPGDDKSNQLLAGPGAFSINFLLNFYFGMDATFNFLHSVIFLMFMRNHKIGKLSYQSIFRVLLTAILTCFADFASSDLSIITRSLQTEISSGFIYFILSWYGSGAIVKSISPLFTWIYRQISSYFYPQKNIFLESKGPNKISLTIQTKKTPHTIKDLLQALDGLEYSYLKGNFSGALLDSIYLKTPLYSKRDDEPLSPKQDSTGFFSQNPCFYVRGTILTIFIFILVTTCFFSLYLYTRDEIKKIFHISNPVGLNTLAGIIFSVTYALGVKITYDTIKPILSLPDLVKKPPTFKKGLLSVSIKLPAILIIYYAAFLSSVTTLVLNKEYGLDDELIKWLSIFGVIFFNGYGGLQIVDKCFSFCYDRATQSVKERIFYNTKTKAAKLFGQLDPDTAITYDNYISRSPLHELL